MKYLSTYLAISLYGKGRAEKPKRMNLIVANVESIKKKHEEVVRVKVLARQYERSSSEMN